MCFKRLCKPLFFDILQKILTFRKFRCVFRVKCNITLPFFKIGDLFLTKLLQMRFFFYKILCLLAIRRYICPAIKK